METNGRLNLANYPHYKIDERTVTVVLNKKSQTTLQNFRCINCGKLMFQYKNPIQLVFDGRVYEAERPIKLPCYNCKVTYIID